MNTFGEKVTTSGWPASRTRAAARSRPSRPAPSTSRSSNASSALGSRRPAHPGRPVIASRPVAVPPEPDARRPAPGEWAELFVSTGIPSSVSVSVSVPSAFPLTVFAFPIGSPGASLIVAFEVVRRVEVEPEPRPIDPFDPCPPRPRLLEVPPAARLAEFEREQAGGPDVERVRPGPPSSGAMRTTAPAGALGAAGDGGSIARRSAASRSGRSAETTRSAVAPRVAASRAASSSAWLSSTGRGSSSPVAPRSRARARAAGSGLTTRTGGRPRSPPPGCEGTSGARGPPARPDRERERGGASRR